MSLYRFEDSRLPGEEALAGMKRCLGEQDPSTLATTDELAGTYEEICTVHPNEMRSLLDSTLKWHMGTHQRHYLWLSKERSKLAKAATNWE
ncbi:hypothetical protein OCU04_000056 [Sclerotinia nivalis]|uniref:Uncharacterized protein n=1 Tax=Sclerotinia nivalis TaxID=352851 RepID=A0A9X0DNC4_9HELO|nr:hypothetical protein OCU04_000056 [Sclerotinia nivalis]